jgi:hypothetical protein
MLAAPGSSDNSLAAVPMGTVEVGTSSTITSGRSGEWKSSGIITENPHFIEFGGNLLDL